MPSSASAGAAPLEGVRVVDLSRVLAGPTRRWRSPISARTSSSSSVRAKGDETRCWGPPYAGGEAAYYLAVNRGKRSVAIDLKHPAGLRLAFDRSAAADVVIENFRPGAAARLGLDAAAIHARNSRAVYCSITGFGRREPRERPGYDFIVQAESGPMAITGEREPDAPPAKISTPPAAVPPPLLGRTRARCSPSWGSTTRDSRRSRRPAWWRRPGHRIVA